MEKNDEFLEIVNKHRSSLFKYCYYRLYNNITLAETTLDDIICVLYKKYDTLDVGDNIRAYLYRVADNCIKHNLSQYNREQHFDSLEEAIENHKFDYIATYDEYFIDEQLTEEEYIKQIKESLPDEYKIIFTYRFVDKKTLMEISSLTQIPYSSLRLRIHKIELLVRKEIKKIFY